MKFENALHFKNYVRRIAESCGYDKYEFEQTKIPSKLIDLYEFQIENQMELMAIGIPNITDHFITELKQINYCEENQKLNVFLDVFIKVCEIFDQAKIVCQQIDMESVKDDFNLFNYFDSEFLKPHFRLKQLVREKDKFNYLNEKDFIPSTEFKEFVEKHVGKFGLYFLYDEHKALMYIGKSTRIGVRILSSIREKQVNGYVKVALTETIADIHVYETYYILKENPFYNVEFKAHDNLSFKLKPLKKSKLIKILTKI